MIKHQPSPSDAEAVKALSGEAWHAWKVQAERTRSLFHALSAAQLTNEDDPELGGALDTCARAVAAFIAAVEEWPEEATMSTMLHQGAKLCLAKAAVLEAMKVLLSKMSEEVRIS
jgi:hypothetical protein